MSYTKQEIKTIERRYKLLCKHLKKHGSSWDKFEAEFYDRQFEKPEVFSYDLISLLLETDSREVILRAFLFSRSLKGL